MDLAAVCNTKVFPVDPKKGHFGFHLTEEGADRFEARGVNVEAQWASEAAIAAVERNGGVVTTAYFDIFSVTALVNPKRRGRKILIRLTNISDNNGGSFFNSSSRFFQTGKPIPRRLLPPADCVGYYSDPANRGYLADPKKVNWHFPANRRYGNNNFIFVPFQIAEERLVLAQKYGYELPEIKEEDELLTAIKDPR